MLRCPLSYKKMANSASSIQCTNNRQFLLVVNLIVISFCKTIYFVTLACFSVILIYPNSLFSYFTIIILSVMTAVTFPFRPPRLAFAICGWRWQNDVHEIKYSMCVSERTSSRTVELLKCFRFRLVEVRTKLPAIRTVHA